MKRLLVALTYLFLYVPIVVLIVFSFNSKSFPAPWDSFTFHWYHELFHSKDLWVAFSNSLVIALTSTFISLTMSVLLIFFRASGGKVGKFLALYYGNLIIPETVLAVGLLGYFTMLNIPLGMPTLIAAHTVLGLGFVIPVLYSRYVSLDPRLVEASLDLGASPLQTFFKITLPLLRPSMIATGLLIFIISFDDFILSYFCAGSNIQTLSLYLLAVIRSGLSPVVNALSAVLFLFSCGLVMLFFSPKIRSRIF
ncbi:MAG: ABC transporter permease [Chlamydiia bacterium]|nr:ABC transporter permease [Chlamydiia bacterium]MCP5508880.1 ABC transporter permease [Chlamydiales bacterium]HPE84583.1 ABC transporter permease [Chlamydiales bacterium]